MEFALRISTEAPVNFAVTALITDGLRCPPFDVHPPGDRVLRDAGLTSSDWWDWVRSLTAHDAAASRQSLHPTSPEEWKRLEKDLEPLFRPALLCPGAEALRSRLDDLWLEQLASLDRWKRKVSAEYRGAFWGQSIDLSDVNMAA